MAEKQGKNLQPVKLPKHPSLYQINTRALLGSLEDQLGRSATLDDIPDSFIDWVASLGFHIVYLLGVWQTGDAGVKMSMDKMLPEGHSVDNIASSPFAITDYRIHESLGGEKALKGLRERLLARNLKLLVDFVPNHVAVDHIWTRRQPGKEDKTAFIMKGSSELLQKEPENYFTVKAERDGEEDLIFAHGRDPYFSGWTDTAQLNYFNPDLREEMIKILEKVASLADGVRCDMAMLVTNKVFAKTWAHTKSIQSNSASCPQKEFWESAIPRVKDKRPGFLFMAEVYWDMEWDLQQLGFDYTYDKRLYDRLKSVTSDGSTESALQVKGHLQASEAFQDKSVRFLENHDEHRAAAVFSNFDQHLAALTLTFTSPGLRFFYDGQLHGRKKFLSMHLKKRAPEPEDEALLGLYVSLLKDVLQRPPLLQGKSCLLNISASDDGNSSHRHLVARIAWLDKENPKDSGNTFASPLLVIANLSNSQSDGHVHFPSRNDNGESSWLPAAAQNSKNLLLKEIFPRSKDSAPLCYLRNRQREVEEKGCWFRLKPWESHIFEIIGTDSDEI